MSEDQIKNNNNTSNNNSEEQKPFVRGGQREFKKNKRNPRKGREGAPRSEFDQKILDIRRVTRVSSGGRRFSFSVAIVIGDKKGKVGVGVGKAGDTSLAIEKAVKNAKKDMLKLELNTNGSINHDTEAKYSSACVVLKSAPGRGIVAGSALRDVVELVGLKNINGKILSGSKNKLNIAKATIKALSQLKPNRSRVNVKSEKK
ncbi:30S ribosomal protein S5 [Candidatus Nomurabacteria bacterium]|nr:30S ribosomal protein S5 [Candidatus Nomurabacteria bacterium]